jgi:prevent-host-death family protein
MDIVNIDQAKTHLSRLVERAAGGEEIIIGKAGKPVARLTAYHEKKRARVPGIWKGKVSIAPDFDELPQDLAKAFQTDET